jgi:hypothetical protein
MESVMEYFPAILFTCFVLSTYAILLVAKVLTMKIKEDSLREYGSNRELQNFLRKKTLRHILTLGLL